MKLEFSGQILEKYSDDQISWKSFSWGPSCPMHMDGQTDRQTDRQTWWNS